MKLTPDESDRFDFLEAKGADCNEQENDELQALLEKYYDDAYEEVVVS